MFGERRRLGRKRMAYSINRRPLLGGSDSEFEDDIETEMDDASVSVPDQKHLLPLPRDRYNLAYIVFYLLGINTLIPWAFFITADEYWMYKFREIHSNNTGLHNYTHTEILEKRTDLQASFTSYLNIASAIPSTLFLILNTFLSKILSQQVRMIGTQSLILLLFIMTTAFVKINTDEWQNTFLIIVLTSFAIVNALSAVFGGSLMGIVGRFNPKYITAMSSGQALGGIFTALTEIVSLWIGASPVVSGLVYFIIGDVVLLCSLIAYIFIEREEYFLHHMVEKPRPQEPNFSVNAEVGFVGGHRTNYLSILKRIWPHALAIFLTFFVTMAVYPAVTVLVESKDKGKGYAWNDIYFVPVVTYLTFSCGDYVGRFLAGIFLWPKGKPWLIVIFAISRAIFVPALMFCNAQPRHHLPVYITDDGYYILLTIIFAIGNGYLCNIAFILVPTVVDPHDKEIASAMMGAFLGLGISIGSALSLLLVKSL
ncbi:equilibrative nucleoside transporter 2 isoform X1 [Diachasma alloeum]|uniref:equilibrative nucleoside transporter 2 isoform X1 n=2 Tax=Diachasma alloeum TaxID=454923 RepID=UPI00073842AE|nr:equilibrative nucleoside transporter 2 isoform X1 [Diachasma alloeum]XP_015117629.1 equilibrative nucleoside transporter 2 isoform X1 [Diachasma alloeum]XP_015117638.1 equilibrative nucleoside transporter 2 isoform X1 [Diachasma alloeum]